MHPINSELKHQIFSIKAEARSLTVPWIISRPAHQRKAPNPTIGISTAKSCNENTSINQIQSHLPMSESTRTYTIASQRNYAITYISVEFFFFFFPPEKWNVRTTPDLWKASQYKLTDNNILTKGSKNRISVV